VCVFFISMSQNIQVCRKCGAVFDIERRKGKERPLCHSREQMSFTCYYCIAYKFKTCPLQFEMTIDISCVNVCIIIANLSTERLLVINVEPTRSA
jgi:hypothetical protein